MLKYYSNNYSNCGLVLQGINVCNSHVSRTTDIHMLIIVIVSVNFEVNINNIIFPNLEQV
jgi:hypothetical protein